MRHHKFNLSNSQPAAGLRLGSRPSVCPGQMACVQGIDLADPERFVLALQGATGQEAVVFGPARRTRAWRRWRRGTAPGPRGSGTSGHAPLASRVPGPTGRSATASDPARCGRPAARKSNPASPVVHPRRQGSFGGRQECSRRAEAARIASRVAGQAEFGGRRGVVEREPAPGMLRSIRVAVVLLVLNRSGFTATLGREMSAFDATSDAQNGKAQQDGFGEAGGHLGVGASGGQVLSGGPENH